MAGRNILKEYDNNYIEKCIFDMAEGNLDGMQRLYEYTSSAIYGYALSILKDSSLSEDIVHDCYLSVYSSAKQYKPYGKALAWMMTIVRNLCYERLRKDAHVLKVEIEDWMFVEANENLSAEEKLTIEQYLKILNNEEREIVMLHAIGGFKHREIAKIMGKTLTATLSRYNRAIKKLREQLEKGGY